MARVKRSVHSKKKRRKILANAEGYRGARSRSVRKANEQVMHSGNYAYRDRRARKGEFRRLWIVRINAACRENDISYSRFVAGLKAAEIAVVESSPRQDGRNMTMVLHPNKKPKTTTKRSDDGAHDAPPAEATEGV